MGMMKVPRSPSTPATRTTTVAIFMALVATSILLIRGAVAQSLATTIPPRLAQQQCYTTQANIQYPGDRIDNPVFGGGGHAGMYTLQQCINLCADHQQMDARGRRCVAIEWSDGGQSLPSSAQRPCAQAWSCTHTQFWSGGSVFILNSFAPTTAPTEQPRTPTAQPTAAPTGWWQHPSVPNVTEIYHRLQQAESQLQMVSSIAAAGSTLTNSIAQQALADNTEQFATTSALQSQVASQSSLLVQQASSAQSQVAQQALAQSQIAAMSMTQSRIASTLRAAAARVPQRPSTGSSSQSSARPAASVSSDATGGITLNSDGVSLRVRDLLDALNDLRQA